MAKLTIRPEILNWLTALGINPADVPIDSDMVIRPGTNGGRALHYEAFVRDADGYKCAGPDGWAVREARTVPLTVDPPPTWRPHEKPTREQLLAAVERVRALAEAANTKPKAWALHPAAVLSALDGKPLPDTVIRFDGQLTDEMYETLKTRWIREHGGRPVPLLDVTPVFRPSFPWVQGRCPACGGSSSLFHGDGGYITCSRIDCPAPDAATTLLEKPAAEEQRDAEHKGDAHPLPE
jgi:hypothetical protein